MTVSKRPPTATKVARKRVPTAAAGKPSTSEQDPEYEPPEGGGVAGSQMRIQTQRM